ncbi:MAG TPA: MauE/DoxX family redox-associated membrane protein [Gemmataceae bacterium]|nr:MauE/DoxX family redox-associated membrane protein [Gemmataceae bacterium]
MRASLVANPVGLFLLATAALKLWHFLAGGSELTPAWLDPVLILYEAALGFGLLFARRPAGLWLVAVCTFAVFVGFNLHAIWIGQASCGCFGAVTVSPWGALVLDLVALALLVAWAWRDRETRALRASAPDAAAFLLGFGLAGAVLLTVAGVGFGSVAGARASLRGDEIYLDPPAVDLGAVRAGESRESLVTVFNAGPGDLRVVGGTANCACTLIQELPATIPPGQSRSLRISVKAPASTGAFGFQATLWTDSPTNQAIPVLVRGRSVEPQQGRGS